MKYRQSFRGAMIVIAALVGINSRSVIAQVPPSAGTPAPDHKSPLVVSIQLNKSGKSVYHVGDPIQMTLTAKNTTADPVNLTFPNSQRYDFVIHKGKSASGPVVWQWSADRMFAMFVSNTKLAPGQALTFTEKYPPKGSANSLKAGIYTVVGSLTSTEKSPYPSATTTFKVE